MHASNKIRPVAEDEAAAFPKAVIVPLENPFSDERGSIQPLVDQRMESAVIINTANEFDGSDAGARPDEAVSWGKIKIDGDSVKVSRLRRLSA